MIFSLSSSTTILYERESTSFNSPSSYKKNPIEANVIIGEIDAPEKQSQKALEYNYLKNGNTLLYGNEKTKHFEEFNFSILLSRASICYTFYYFSIFD